MGLILNSGMTLGPGFAADAGYVYVPPPPPPPIVSNGLVLHYDFSDPECYTTGTSITDLSTATNIGTVLNSYGALTFVSTGTNSYFNWSSNAGTNFTNSIQTTNSNVYKDFTIICYPDFTAGGIVGLFGFGVVDKSLRFYNGVDGTGPWLFSNAGNGDDWAAAATTFYVNGQASNQMVAGWNVLGGARNNGDFPEPGQLYIGASYSAEGRNFKGKIAVVLMYNRTLTEQEHLQNYNHYKARYGL